MLRPYQTDAIYNTEGAWERGQRNVALILATGAGKTFTAANIIKRANVPTAVIAHRQELVSQLSLALGAMGIHHRLICPDDVITQILKAHRIVLGKTMYDHTSPVFVAGVDTLIRRNVTSFKNVKLWVQDECHHLLRENKWGTAADMFPNARGLGLTATPIRADGNGLGRHADGVFDVMVEGPTGQELINMGYLSPYEIACVKPEDLDFSHVEHGADGDFKQKQLRMVTKASRRLVGDIVGQYKARANGRLGITFCVDIEHAAATTAAFNEAGVPAALVTGETGIVERAITLEKYKRREYLQLVNVDLFGEGFDVPGVEVVSMGRRTDSFALYSQQFGRSLRPVYAQGWGLDSDEDRKAAIANGPKPKALIIDHVGNVVHHRLPTSRKLWTLDRREKRSSGERLSEEDKLRVCDNPVCCRPYPAFKTACPFCGHEPTVSHKVREIELVDGDLILLDESVLMEMHRESERIMGAAFAPKGLPQPAILSIIKKHSERIEAQKELRETIAAWGGVQTFTKGLSVRESQKLFYLTFGTDVMTAQTLGAREARELNQLIGKAMQC